MSVPFLKGWMYIPEGMIPDIAGVKNLLTVHPKKFKHEHVPKPPVTMYDTTVDGYLGVPPDFGFQYIPEGVQIDDLSSNGHPITVPRRADPNHPRAADGQAEFMGDLIDALDNNHTVLAIADTGCGKTVAALDTMAHYGVTTIVFIHLKRLADRWIEDAKNIFGLTDDDIGYVGGSTEDWRGKKLVLAMMPTLSKRQMPEEFYDYFGFAVWDEVHRTGSTTFRKTLGQVNAKMSLGLTATDERPDGMHRVYHLYFGGRSVVSEQEAEPVTAYFYKYMSKRKPWGGGTSVLNKCLALDPVRNDWIVSKFLQLYDKGYCALGIGASVEHIESIIKELVARGIPEDDIGQYTGSYNEDGENYKTPSDYLEWAEKNPPLILATSGMIKEGISIERLNAGIELVPTGQVKQAIGRVRRPPSEGVTKADAVWLSLVDLNSGLAVGLWKKRMKELERDPTAKTVILDAF